MSIVSAFDEVTSACPDPPSCFLCADCEARLEQAIAAALAEQDAEIAELQRAHQAVSYVNHDQGDKLVRLESALAQAHARIAQLEARYNTEP